MITEPRTGLRHPLRDVRCVRSPTRPAGSINPTFSNRVGASEARASDALPIRPGRRRRLVARWAGWVDCGRSSPAEPSQAPARASTLRKEEVRSAAIRSNY